MVNAPPAIPNRFPCWCRATYSWGGESKGDLGFIEGDLIECLNAGDGSWWMGRLRRNKTTGLFPSNFVKILEADFQPVSRGPSPMPSPHGSLSQPKATPQKAKTCRKPFQSYSRAASPYTTSQQPTPNISRQTSMQEEITSVSRNSSHLNVSATPSRQSSHLHASSSPARQLSYMSPTRQGTYLSRPARPPSPVYSSRMGGRAPSPESLAYEHYGGSNQDEDVGSSPPPPPPPHRVAYDIAGSPTPTPTTGNRVESPPGHSPVTHSPRPTGQTPSPLRDAMDDVMSSLDGMRMRNEGEEEQSPEPEERSLDPWSPDAYDEFRSKPRARKVRRPRSSLGIASSQITGGSLDEDPEPFRSTVQESPSHLCDYVDRMDVQPQYSSAATSRPRDELFLPEHADQQAPKVPPKDAPPQARPQSSFGMRGSLASRTGSRRLRARKSAYELGQKMLDRTFSTKTSATNSSSGVHSVSTNGTTSTKMTSQSIMSGRSAGGFSATSAGSYARRKWGNVSKSRPQSVIDIRQDAILGLSDSSNAARPKTPSQYSNHLSRPASRAGEDNQEPAAEPGGLLGGLTTPKHKKSGFFRKLVDSAKAGAASTRGTIADGRIESQRSPIKTLLPNGVTGFAGGTAAQDMGLTRPKSENDWMQVRRDVNRSNSLSRNERLERIEKCQMMNHSVIAPVDELFETVEGDESVDGSPVLNPTDYQAVNLQLVDKSARFTNSLPPMTNAASLAQGYLCRPYRSDVQRLRAIFIWVSEKVSWEEDFEGEVDTRRVIQMRRGCSEELAVLVFEMCAAVGMHAEIIRGSLKAPGEVVDHLVPNHWWNAVVADGQWRIMDCSLASPTNPKRGLYSSAGPQVAENGFFLARPSDACYTHIPSQFDQQHLCPPISPDVLLALPCACPPYFRNGLRIVDYDTSLFRIENLELVHVQFTAPSDVECVAEVEARSYAQDADGDFFESGDTATVRGLVQAEWVTGQKRFTVKAHLPSNEGYGTLKVYAGKRGLMHSVKNNPHPLAFAIPIVHTGHNPPYEFLLRHPTPHAQRHDLYVAQPQCRRLALNNTYVFAVRQHPSSPGCVSPMEEKRAASPLPFTRPSSAMSMVSAAPSDYFSQASSNSSQSSHQQQVARQEKPAKLAIQAPSGKIMRLLRKSDNCVSTDEAADGGVWETIIKIGERGVWRGLVLADRSARWCVFGEWDSV